jgi:dipeptidase E
MTAGTILAMGGGGFSMEPENPLLDDFLLSLVPGVESPRVCFLPTASGDSDDYVQRFEQAFAAPRADASVLTLFKREHADLRSIEFLTDVKS